MSIEFTDEQLAYVNAGIEENIFLEACPGSGKTEVVAAKVAKEIDAWKKYPGGLAALSFANSATDELVSRVSKYLSKGQSIYPHFLGTFDSFIYKNIVSPLSKELTGYVGKNGDASIHIVEPSVQLGYRTKYQYAQRGKIKAHHYSFDLVNERVVFDTGDTKLSRSLNAIKLKDWQFDDFIAAKNTMLEGGFATYRDIECLAMKALSEEKYEDFVNLLVQRYPSIIVDECQDLSKEQLFILKKLADKGIKLHLVGDLHQAIYGFRDVDPAKVEQFVQANNFSKQQLTRNFRSCQNIVNLCSKLTGRTNIIGNVSWLNPRCIVVQYDDCPTEVTVTLENKCNGYDNNVLVSRGYSILCKFQAAKSEPKNIELLALAVQLFNPQDMEAINQSLQYFSEFLRYHLKESYKSNSFNCPESVVSSLSWRRFLYNSLNYLIFNGLQNLDVKWSDWTKSAKTLVRVLPKQGFCPENVSSILIQLEGVNLKSPTGCTKDSVNSSLGVIKSPSTKFKKTTIHGAKGETHDVTIVVSSARSGKDSHWKDWLKKPDSEAARFAYVASSRPKHLLIWVVKTLTAPEKKQLESVGFTII
jgi:DNA helicase-2/ATP-dependent DNA helicase PcrA